MPSTAGGAQGATGGTGTNYGLSTASNAPTSSVSGIKVAGANVGAPAANVPSGATGLLDRINKYDNIIKVAGDFATGMAKSKASNDQLAQQNAQFQQQLALDTRRSTAVAIPGALPVSAGVPQAVAPIVQNRSTGLLNTTSQQVQGVA